MKQSLFCLTISCFSMIFLTSCSRKSLGKLTVSTANATLSYCLYSIKGNNNPDASFYRNGDTVCIECCTARTPKPWPDQVQQNNPCPGKIKFLSSDGTVEYEADALGSPAICSTCPSAQGYYACP